MVEIFVKAQDTLIAEMGERKGSWVTVAAFFGGMFLIAVIDRLIPSEENPHEVKSVIAESKDESQTKHLMRMGVFTS